jgi:hypothetical protein
VTITFITPVADTSKGIIMEGIAQGDGKAMVAVTHRSRQHLASDGRSQLNCSTLGRKQEDTIAALLTQRNIEEAAHSAGIGTRTLLRWLKLPEFQKAYREARRAAFGQAIARLQQGTSAAATTPLKLLIEPNTPASVRARVADSIFNHAAKAIEIEDIEARVSELERTAGLSKPG